MRLIIVISLILVACTPKHDEAPEYAQATGVCGATLKAAFDSYYHPIFTNSCSSCHFEQHGSDDDMVAFNSFIAFGEERIFNNAVSENHNPPYTGEHLRTSMLNARSQWDAARPIYIDCLSIQ